MFSENLTLCKFPAQHGSRISHPCCPVRRRNDAPPHHPCSAFSSCGVMTHAEGRALRLMDGFSKITENQENST